METADVIIVGGGPAGSACAAQLQRAGVDCMILDKATFPRNKPCAGWITPDVFDLLEIAPSEYPHSLTHFDQFQIAIKGIRLRLRVNQYAIRRIEFDDWLLARSGARVIQQHVHHIHKKDGFFVIDDLFSCRYLVGAGGTHCPVQRSLFDTVLPRQERDLIVAMEDEVQANAHDSNCRLWFFREGLPGYAWYVPKQGGYVNIGVGGSHTRLQEKGVTIRHYWQRLLVWLNTEGLLPDLELRPMGWNYYLQGDRVSLRAGNALLAGDAAGLATRDMGEGIRAAVQSGISVGKTIVLNRDYIPAKLPRYSIVSLLFK